MEDLLSVSSTKRISHIDKGSVSTEEAKPAIVDTSADVLKALQSEPSFGLLKSCLVWLSTPQGGFNIKIPGPQASQIISTLVYEIVPTYWQLLKRTSDGQSATARKLLSQCLSSIAGLGALCAKLRILLDAVSKDKDTKLQNSKKIQVEVRDVLELLHRVLRGKGTLSYLWQEIERSDTKPVQRHFYIKELVSRLASGKILSLAAQALILCDLSKAEDNELNWMGEGRVYTSWLGANIADLLQNVSDENADACKLGASLLNRGLSLGYDDQLVEAAFLGLWRGKEDYVPSDLRLFNSLPNFDSTRILSVFLRLTSKRLVSTATSYSDRLTGGISAAVASLVLGRSSLLEYLVDWLTNPVFGGLASEMGVRRAVLTVLFRHSHNADVKEAVKEPDLEMTYFDRVLQKLLNLFSDNLFIQHSSMLNQESCAQSLLLSVGWMYRSNKKHIQDLAKSGPYLNSVSNRLAASSERARFLGMVFGMAVSNLVDPADKKMNFDVEAVNGPEGEWYRNLTQMKDVCTSIGDLKTSRTVEVSALTKPTKNSQQKAKMQATMKVVEIVDVTEEIEDEVDSSDDDLPVYAKPDSDPEDEDEDPTLIQRNKPVPPVYVRDLIAGLKDTENFERHRLAISSAANLIRRKSNFGSEVSDHIERLASQITSLKDSYDLEKFQETRIQAMIALVVAEPLKMGKWFSNMLFVGDYALSQRASMLTALTMAARELAGYREEDAELTGAYVANEDLFPSKKLPDKLDKIYRIDAAPVDALSVQLERAMIKPMAAEAADKLAGPKVLQVRTFSSRMEVEKKRKRPITNQLAKVVADGFFYPLTSRWRANMQVYGDSSIFKNHFLQAHFLKTLALILSASGTSTLSLPAMTVEFWGLLLSVRTAALGAKPVLEALLFGFLTILDINSNDQRRIAEEHSRELLETQAWTEQVLESLGTGTKEDEKIRLLAAGVLVRAKEVVDKYQRLLMGDLVDYM